MKPVKGEKQDINPKTVGKRARLIIRNLAWKVQFVNIVPVTFRIHCINWKELFDYLFADAFTKVSKFKEITHNLHFSFTDFQTC